ncbi:dienelactone hydrolase [Planoprotostelium fungivorum]|uniref:Dienelactone hydrolase n=1 Tax=Planoprotostelium fungivorum TaxID=1890364 RepID=A0A2P6NBJ4_9EUKA|nr:dienelactone hydrolase [Planoprotostelium fungivorum]
MLSDRATAQSRLARLFKVNHSALLCINDRTPIGRPTDLYSSRGSRTDVFAVKFRPNSPFNSIFSSHGKDPRQQTHPSMKLIKLPEVAKTKHISFQLYRQTKTTRKFGYDYFVSTPSGQKPERGWPLLLFLHGSGESQNGEGDIQYTLRHGIPKIILCYDRLKDGQEPKIDIPAYCQSENPSSDDFSGTPVPEEVCKFYAENFITVSPSLDKKYGYGWKADVLNALLEEMLPNLEVDLDRVHITGFSMGGCGVWELGVYCSERFASLVPICGEVASNIHRTAQIPQWIFHGDADRIVPLEHSQEMYQALMNANAKNVKFTIYPKVHHDAWTITYNNIQVGQWILEQKRGS